jgi:hypothetical protein
VLDDRQAGLNECGHGPAVVQPSSTGQKKSAAPGNKRAGSSILVMVDVDRTPTDPGGSAMPMRAQLPIRRLSVDDGSMKSWDVTILVATAVMLMLMVLLAASAFVVPRTLDQPAEEQAWIVGP